MEFLRLFAGSFYSPDAYRRMKAKQGNGFAYSAILIAIISLLAVVSMGVFFHQAVFVERSGKPPLFDDLAMQVAEQLPVMTYKDGQLHTREPKAHDIFLQADIFGHHMAGTVATIDTTGGTTYETMQTPVLVTSHEAIMRSKKETKIKSLREMMGEKKEPLLIDHAKAVEGAQTLVGLVHDNLAVMYTYLGLLVGLGFMGIMYLQRLCLLVVLGLGGRLIGKALRSPVDFATSMRLAALGMTPVTVCDVLSFVFWAHPLGSGRVLLCGLIMLAAALYVTRQTPLAEPA